MAYSPTVRRRRLSLALRQLRRDSGLLAEAVALRLEWNPSKVTRIERNEWKQPSVRDVRDLLDVYGVPDGPEREALITLAREARQRGWWEEYKDVFAGRTLPELEAEASHIMTVKALLIPGLLQTADYATAVFRGGRVQPEAEVARLVEGRLARQQILDQESPPILWAILDEAALLKHVGGVEVMHRQLLHLIEMAERPSIGIQVLPAAVGAHAAMENAFTILQFSAAEDPSVVYIEMLSGDAYLELPDQVARYTLAYNHVCASALSADASVAYLADLVTQFE